jgi:hypothetical protein
MGIRLAKEDDAEGISQLIRGLSERFIAQEFSEEGRMNLLSSMTTELTRQRIQNGFRYHVYEEAGALLGVVATRDNSHLYHLFRRCDPAALAGHFGRNGLRHEDSWATTGTRPDCFLEGCCGR